MEQYADATASFPADRASANALRLLVVDREGELRDRIVDALSLGGLYEVVAVTTGNEALVQAASHRFEAIVLAYDLPDVTGVDVLRTWAAEGKEYPVVMLADEWTYPVVLEATAGGAFDYVVKSVGGITSLPQLVVRAIERQRLLEMVHDLERRLADQARFDPLTRLHRPHHFLELYGRELERLKRYGGSMALLGIDCSRALTALADRVTADQFLHRAGTLAVGQVRATDFAGIVRRGHLLLALPSTCTEGANVVCRRLSSLYDDLCVDWGIERSARPQIELLRVGDFRDLSDFALEWVQER